ncbi:MAG: CHY zinc finger protein [Candidatus Acidiferrales bacterium]
MNSNFPCVRGVDLDPQTRCGHYRGPTDIIAIKMKCCGVYYACKECHQTLADHALEVWPEDEWNQKAILCGACGVELTIRQYMQCDSRCPACRETFNPGCRNHYHFYFQIPNVSRTQSK